MKFFVAASLLIFFSYQVQSANICYGHDGTCTNIHGCDPASGCPGTVNEILRISPTMNDVWHTMQSYFGGKWTVVQTTSANWYSNWRMAVTCTCNGVVNILVQQ